MIEEILKALSDRIDEMSEDVRISKTFPVKPKWRKIYLEAEKTARKAAEDFARIAKLRSDFWTEVEKGLKLEGKRLRYNSERNEIELIVSKNKKPAKKRK